MENNKAVVIFRIPQRRFEVDLEVPLDISANDLVLALNDAYDLGIQTDNIKNNYFQAERPIALLKGTKTLAEFGVRNGTILHFTEGGENNG